MTSDEFERAIEILLKNQANFDARQEKTDQQLAQTNQQLAAFADTQSGFMQVMLQHLEAQRGINAEMRRITSDLSKAQEQTQRDFSTLAQAQKITQQEISDLASFVRELRKPSSGNGNLSQE
jgi:prefoldin subunit 5